MPIQNRSTAGKEHAPFILKPAGKDYLWGGTRLNDDFAKEIPMEPLAETWECSTHPDGPSVVASGPCAGQTLTQVLQDHPDYLGSRHQGTGELPILIKFIDAKQDLSVQVHPDDEYARIHENGAMGKNEMWYVLDAARDAKLVYGFSHDVTKEQVHEMIQKGTFENALQHVKIQKGDVFYIKAGTVHAIGAGALVAEIQESSNLTYRLYDYNRVDKNGNLRELHIEKALEVANRKSSTTPRQPMRQLHFHPGCASELLCRCRYFQVERLLINTERHRQMFTMQTDSASFQVILCVEGCGVLFYDEETIPFFQGDCIFIPAESVPVTLHGKAQFLKVRC